MNEWQYQSDKTSNLRVSVCVRERISAFYLIYQDIVWHAQKLQRKSFSLQMFLLVFFCSLPTQKSVCVVYVFRRSFCYIQCEEKHGLTPIKTKQKRVTLKVYV